MLAENGEQTEPKKDDQPEPKVLTEDDLNLLGSNPNMNNQR